jgi:polyisoprenoid-binding protein YceI
MNKTLASLVISAAALPLLPIGLAHASEWDIDGSHTTAQFAVKHLVVSTVKGTFNKVGGTVSLDDKDLTKSKVEVNIDPASIDTREPKRDAHLKSPDFFDVAKFPTLTFKSTKVEKAGKNKLKVTGDLTMHGVTKSITLAVDGPSPETKTPFSTIVRAVSLTGKLDRKDWGLNWNKALEAGGMLVSDQVQLDISAELVKKADATVAEAKPAAEVKPAVVAPAVIPAKK